MVDMGIRCGGAEWAVPVIIGKDTVYEHTDIVKIESDSSDELYQYHEYQYTHEEWIQILGERNKELQAELDNTNQTIDTILTDIIPAMLG